ncbi:DUF2334 domain-containing protein [Myxococcota bacterium]|nr:DUF2334 domain-containing protein [Myxococcota bacterium]
MGTTVFFRDDDIGALTAPTRTLVELLAEERVPCNYLVIPRYVTREAAKYMIELRRAHPGLVELNQHGYLHEQVIRGVHDYSEFAGGRPYAEQRAAILEGRKILEDLLGDDFSPDVFTPPSHKYDGNTLRALKDAGFTVFSSGVRPDLKARIYYGVGHALSRVTLLGQRVSWHGTRDPETGLVDLSTCINVDEEFDRQGNRKLKRFPELRAEYEHAKTVHSIVGILVHHGQYTSPDKADTLRELVRYVKADPGVELVTIETAAERLGATIRRRHPAAA